MTLLTVPRCATDLLIHHVLLQPHVCHYFCHPEETAERWESWMRCENDRSSLETGVPAWRTHSNQDDKETWCLQMGTWGFACSFSVFLTLFPHPGLAASGLSPVSASILVGRRLVLSTVSHQITVTHSLVLCVHFQNTKSSF